MENLLFLRVPILEHIRVTFVLAIDCSTNSGCRTVFLMGTVKF